MIDRSTPFTGFVLGLCCFVTASTLAQERAPGEAAGFSIEFGNRFWIGGTANDVKTIENDTGRVGSRLRWSGVDTVANETTLWITHERSGFFVKGYGGIGRNIGGALDDEDYIYDFPTPEGPVTGKFLDTYSKGDESTQVHGALDLGYALPLPRRWPLRLSAFAGGFTQRQDLLAKGVRCNADEARNILCGAPGTVLIPYDRNSIRHETTMRGARLGVEPVLALPGRLTLRTEAAWVFEGSFRTDDSHYLRVAGSPDPDNNLGPTPNIVSDGDGLGGVQLEVELSWASTAHWRLTAGARYWRFHSGRAPTVFGARLPVPLESGEQHDRTRVEQYGLTLGVSYRF
jgi:hypothetical protein